MERNRTVAPHSFEALTGDEKAAAVRAELYATHKARGSLGTYYEMYPDERPKPKLSFYEDRHGSELPHER